MSARCGGASTSAAPKDGLRASSQRGCESDAETFIEELNASHPDGKPPAFAKASAGKVVTEVKPLDRFYPAEDHHRDYYANNPANPYCQVVINPKLEKVQQTFAELLK